MWYPELNFCSLRPVTTKSMSLTISIGQLRPWFGSVKHIKTFAVKGR